MRRFEICVLFAALSWSTVTSASPIRLDARDNRLGSATAFGHARYVQALGEFNMGSATYPVNLVFNSNPADAPGAFGPYWRIPLFASTVVQFNRNKLYWDGPDERRQFFVRDRSHDVRRDEAVFIERGKDWQATVSRRGEILIEALNEPDWTFRYKDGRLETFRIGSAADPCRITWSGRGLPLYITNETTNRRIFEVQYRGATDPARILLGEQPIAVEMGDAELTAPDGSSNYRNYRVSFLRSLTLDSSETKTFAYSKADSRQRQITLVDEAKETIAKTLDLAVNRMEIFGASAGDSGNWIEWEAKSGFVTADSGSRYEVANDGWDPNIKAGTFDVTPDKVAIQRFPEGGSEQRWSYHWSSGVKVYTDLATGKMIRLTNIMSEGPANGKLRKREILKDGKWTLDRKNSYGPAGRLVRAVENDDVRVLDRGPDGREVTEYLNGVLIRSVYVDADGRKVSEYMEDGNLIKTVVERSLSGGSKAIIRMEDYTLILGDDGDRGSISTVSTPNSLGTLFRVKEPAN